MLHSA